MRLGNWYSSSLFRPRHRQQTLRRNVERLEARQLLTVAIEIDYSRDTNHFFDTPERREIMELAASTIAEQLHDQLLEIAPSGSNTWSINFSHPSSTANVTIKNPTIPENTLRVYVGARNISSLAFGGPGGWSALGNESWYETIEARGQFGALESTASDFAPWGGSITFDSNANWHFGSDIDGFEPDEHDFLSVAMHELGHVLGVGTSDSWSSWVVGDSFTGPNTEAERDDSPGPVPLHDDAHFEEDFEDGGQEVAMDPTIMVGTRKLFTAMDYAALKDIGWEVGESAGSGEEPSAPATHTINVSQGVAHKIIIQDDSSTTNFRSRVLIDGVSTNFVNPTDELIIYGGTKNDIITIQSLDPAFAAKITILAGLGNDRIDGTLSAVPINAFGDIGNDTLIGGTADDSLNGEAGNDLLSGGGGNDSVIGGDGGDRVNGNDGQDTLEGGLGNDVLSGGADDDSAFGGDGNDRILGDAGNDMLTGEIGADLLYGGANDDSLLGGVGSDRLYGDAGNDTLNGGADHDFLYGGAGDDGISGFTGNDYLQGDAGHDTLIGGVGDDRLRGGVGNDVLLGKEGNDQINGDQDGDTVAGGSGEGRDSGDRISAAAADQVDEAFVFEADWIDAV